MENRLDYHNKIPLATLTEFTLHEGLTQVINFKTWSRTINGVKKESLLDHIYTNNVSIINNVNFEVPTFGDHVLAFATIPTSLNSKGGSYTTALLTERA